MKKTIFFYLLVIILLSLPAIWSLFHPGFFSSDDGEWMVVRLSDFHRSFVSGQIPVRWAARLNHGYGYPVFNFLYPLAFYLGEFFYFFTGSFVNSVKLIFISSFLFSGFFMFWWGRKVWGELGGLVSAIFYVYAPYRFLDVYVRGSIGEAVSFIFLPLIFGAIYELSQKKKWLYVVIGAFAYAGLIMSHNIMAMIFTPIILLAIDWHRRKVKNKKRFLFLASGFVLLGFGLSCFFWLPALYDKQFIILDQVTVARFWEHFPTLKQLLIPRWGYGPSIPGPNDAASYQIGPIHLLVVILSLVVWRRQTVFFGIIFALFFFLMLSPSVFIWQTIPALWRLQFPWRLLATTTLASSFLAGATVSTKGESAFGRQLIKPRFKPLLTAGLVILVIGLTYRYAEPEYFVDRGEAFYTTNEATTTVQDEYLPVWVREKPIERAKKKVEVVSGEGKISHLVFNSKKVSFDVEIETESEIQINTIYFPGWQVRVDNQATPTTYDNEKGLMRFTIGPGKHQVVVEFGETPIRLFADIISLASLGVVGGLLIKSRKK